jgi:AmmeMemoRadiSam system protein A
MKMTTPFNLTDEQKNTLLKIARDTITAKITAKKISLPPPADSFLHQPCGCFVTLHVRKQLRGCIGTFEASKPLYETVMEMAESSLGDPRFCNQRIKPDELDSLEIEISVLSPLEKTSDPLSLELGKHGIYIRKGYRAGCFLPQVASEAGWSKEEFLSYCCSHKAGLSADAWKDPKTDVYLFSAVVFHEKG